ncbi:hypothetical protein C8Q74DRAFT_821368 [Fomes fomentarius]|nr:hypothetical protein C8Q74DRAFT_821368 [Fomes fomentarius]
MLVPTNFRPSFTMQSLPALLFVSAMAAAGLTPTSPGPGDIFQAGSTCTIKWGVDTTGGTWTNVSIHLMSGSNGNMTRVAEVASYLDGADKNLSPFNWTCPEVVPYSAIYFYQFTNADDLQDSKWTARFTIASSSGDSEPPEHDRQPDGDPLPWGEGRLKSNDRVSDQDPPYNFKTSEGRQKSIVNEDTDHTRAHSASSDTAGSSDAEFAPSHMKSTSGSCSTILATDSNSVTLTLDTASSPTRHHSSDPPSGTGDAIEASVPTASLPFNEPHSYNTHTRAFHPHSSGAPYSQMGPGVPEFGGMQLAGSGHIRRDDSWLRMVSLYSLMVAMLL